MHGARTVGKFRNRGSGLTFLDVKPDAELPGITPTFLAVRRYFGLHSGSAPALLNSGFAGAKRRETEKSPEGNSGWGFRRRRRRGDRGHEPRREEDQVNGDHPVPRARRHHPTLNGYVSLNTPVSKPTGKERPLSPDRIQKSLRGEFDGLSELESFAQPAHERKQSDG